VPASTARSTVGPQRSRRDRCPGVFRPWPADDGGLVRLRLIGGRISGTSLAALGEVAGRYGDGDVHLTKRANLQLRAMPTAGDGLPDEVVEAIARTGLLPSRTHDLVRNVMVSPQTGLAGGCADLRPVAAELDRMLCLDADLANLPGRFLFVLDDGRGDLAARTCDLGLVALDESSAQLRVGPGWGPVVPLADAPCTLRDLARRFLAVRGSGADAPWHVDELAEPLVPAVDADARALVESPALPFGPVDGGSHVGVPDGVLTPDLLARLAPHAELVVTPWHGVLVPDGPQDEEDQ
jgi:precorrin-3B synthase